MTRKRLPSLVTGAFVMFALTGCGSAQNPHSFSTGRTSWFWNGVWDGLWAPILAIQDFFQSRGYQLYSYGHPYTYLAGFVLGLVVCVSVAGWLFELVSDTLSAPFPVGSRGVARLIVIILLIILVLLVIPHR